MFLLVPAHPGFPGQIPQSRKTVVCVVCKSHMTLTLTADYLESHIVVNDSSTLTNTTIWFVAALCIIADVQTYGRTYIRMDGHFYRVYRA